MIPVNVRQIAEAVGGTFDPPSGGLSVCRVERTSNEVLPGDLFVALKGDRFDGHEFLAEAQMRGAVAALVTRQWVEGTTVRPGLPLIVVHDTYQALGSLAAWYRRHVMDVSTTVIAITGSNGKTTTKRMLDDVLGSMLAGRSSPKSYNNRIGVPLTLLTAERGDRYLVCEVGTSAPGEIAELAQMISPDVGVITSIGEAHLEGLGSMAGVAAEKFALISQIRAGGLAIVNADRPEIRTHLQRTQRPRIVTFGFDPGARLRVEGVEARHDQTSFMLEGRYAMTLRMPGAHHASNATAVFAVARWMGLAPETIIERLGRFVAVEGRTQREEWPGLTLIDDAYNANPASMRTAIDSLRLCSRGRRVLVAGDMMELGTSSERLHGEFVRQVRDSGIEVLVSVGERMQQAVVGHGAECSRMQIIACADSSAAIDALSKCLKTGDTVWVKGSRAIGLERVVEALRGTWSPKAAVA